MNPAHTSRDYNFCMKEALKDCESVLEPGCQFGWQLRIVDRPKMVGIEIHTPYLQSDKTVHDPRITYINADALVVMQKMADETPKSFDAVMMIDIVEHFAKPEALRLIILAEKIAKKKVWMWVPQGAHPQDYDEWNMGGDHWQTHRSIWEAEDLQMLGYNVAWWKDHHRPTNCKGVERSRGTMFALREFYV